MCECVIGYMVLVSSGVCVFVYVLGITRLCISMCVSGCL